MMRVQIKCKWNAIAGLDFSFVHCKLAFSNMTVSGLSAAFMRLATHKKIYQNAILLHESRVENQMETSIIYSNIYNRQPEPSLS